MSWSSGKDSAFALSKLRRSVEYNVDGLFTTVNSDYSRVAMHSTRLSLLRQQAEELRLPLEIVQVPAVCTNEIYEERMLKLIAVAKSLDVKAFGFGDLFLSDIRLYRERMLFGTGIEPVFPLWNLPTNELASDMLNSGIKAVLTCIDPAQMPAFFAGRFFTAETTREFPAGVDPCGENGEFHTFVFGSPDFRREISISIGERVERGGFVFADVLPAF